MEDVINLTEWPFVNLHCVNAIQYPDYNTILSRLATLKPLKKLPSYVFVCVLSFLTTLSKLLFYCSATAIIAEHSYFLWHQKPSASSAPFKLAIQKFNLFVDLKKIKTAIGEASQLKIQDQKHALAMIAEKNCLCELLIFRVFEHISLIYLI